MARPMAETEAHTIPLKVNSCLEKAGKEETLIPLWTEKHLSKRLIPAHFPLEQEAVVAPTAAFIPL